MGATMSSETTAAAVGAVGQLRNDPFAMLPFCGYNMGDYFQHWLNIGEKNASKNLPLFFNVNWFRKSQSGAWLWPGFGENSRVLKWVFERTNNSAKGKESAIGILPDGLDTTGLKNVDLNELLRVDKKAWTDEVNSIDKYLQTFGERLPSGMKSQLQTLKKNVNNLA